MAVRNVNAEAKDAMLRDMPAAKIVVMYLATNHLGHFLLTNTLLDVRKATATHGNIEGRIVNVSSVGHRCIYIQRGNSVRQNQSRYKEEGIPITANSLHPGAVVTNLLREDSFATGSCNNVLCGVESTREGCDREYFSDCNLSKPSPLADD